MGESAAKIFLLHSAPQKNQTFVQEKTRCIFSKTRDENRRLAAQKFLPNGRILRLRTVFLKNRAEFSVKLCRVPGGEEPYFCKFMQEFLNIYAFFRIFGLGEILFPTAE